MDDHLRYQAGFGNALATEARPGALPTEQNGPRVAPYGLFTEQINGTGFTVKRAQNRRTWLYRLRPAIHPRGYTPLKGPARFVGDFSDGVPSPEPMRWRPQPLPEAPTDFLEGLETVAGAGDPSLRAGMAIHQYAANADMARVLVDIDGDLLLAPERGTLRVRTELGWLEVAPGEVAILPRGIRFRIHLADGPSRGWVAELFDGHFQLPERGPIGANGLADERHFLAPVADYEDAPIDTVIVVKQGGRLWQTVQPHSPFDVVAWHGTYAPFKYDLRRFNSYGSVSFDHPDPSILTVLTCPARDDGSNAIDVAVFRGRWDPTEHTFRPPFFHRNAAIEFNMVLASPPGTGAFEAGVTSFTPCLTPHGVSPASHRRATRDDPALDSPQRLSDDSLWLQFESTYLLKVMPWSVERRERGFLDTFQGYDTGELVS